MTQQTQRRLGPIYLAPGVHRRDVLFFILAAMCGMTTINIVPMLLPMVLSQQIGLEPSRHGQIASQLSMTLNIILICLVSFFGALADRLGRKILLSWALIGFFGALIAYPFATQLPMLFGLTLLLAVAQAAQVSSYANLAHFPDDQSRGKFIALFLAGVNIGMTIIVGQLAGMPKWLEDHGFESEIALRLAFWAAACVMVIGAMAAIFGLRSDRGQVKKPDSPTGGELKALVRNIGAVLAHARRHPRFRFSMIVGLTLRLDYSVVAVFLSLWAVAQARSAGFSAAEGMKIAGTIFSCLMVASIISPLLMGFVVDRFNRVFILMLALLFAAVSFTLPVTIVDVFGWWTLLVFVMIGFAEGWIYTAINALVGQEAPAHLRGAATGLFAMAGSLGSVPVVFISGMLFDKVHSALPFILVGFLNLLMFVIGLFHISNKRSSNNE